MSAESSILREVEIMLSERRALAISGPTFKIITRNLDIVAVSLMYLGNEFPLNLSVIGRTIFDFLARHRFIAQSAMEISNGLSREHKARVVGRHSVKMYVLRIRSAIERALADAHLNIDAANILLAETTERNMKLYRLKAKIEWHNIEDIETDPRKPLRLVRRDKFN